MTRAKLRTAMTMMADQGNAASDVQFTGLNGITVPGALRDSLVLLSVVLEQQTELQPTEIMTDTGADTAGLRPYQHAWPLRLYIAGYGCSRRTAAVARSNDRPR